MKGIKIRDVVILLLVFLVVSFIFKLLLLMTVGDFLANSLLLSDSVAVYVTIALSIVLTGLIVGKMITSRVEFNPYAHALLVAVLAGCYRVLRPDFDPLPAVFIGLFGLLNFLAILIGAHVTMPD